MGSGGWDMLALWTLKLRVCCQYRLGQGTRLIEFLAEATKIYELR